MLKAARYLETPRPAGAPAQGLAPPQLWKLVTWAMSVLAKVPEFIIYLLSRIIFYTLVSVLLLLIVPYYLYWYSSSVSVRQPAKGQERPATLVGAAWFVGLGQVLGAFFPGPTPSHAVDDALAPREDQPRVASKSTPYHLDDRQWLDLLHKCSICFDAPLDICLYRCGDQFCRACFERYVDTKVRDSWGIHITRIKCPVCSIDLSVTEWSRYVHPDVLARYRQYNRPFRAIMRQCGQCQAEVPAAVVPATKVLSKADLQSFVQTNLARMDALLANTRPQSEAITRLSEALYTTSSAYTGCFWPRHSVTDITSTTLALLDQMATETRVANHQNPCHNFMETIRAIHALVRGHMQVTTGAESWRELQFRAIAQFPETYCTQCNAQLCLQCGESSHHLGQTCLEYLAVVAAHAQAVADKKANHAATAVKDAQWMLTNGKRCPRCCILITRDEGCHQVHCLYCDHTFCWICLRPWSRDCGYFVCQKERVSGLQSPTSVTSPTACCSQAGAEGGKSNLGSSVGVAAGGDAPEDGVPDVQAIQARLHPY
ncbi:hypothetical protein H4R34_001796 [Dimargaris verticillata]|uniref:RING-type domain-containing protein n=1 Tax=Dimargaris verticillata TaxID=2761393 RepID=A0A9W8B2Z0_9FUNG|nr:hypothetical protein H4R34_001796 [Dimargaris verticillata]